MDGVLSQEEISALLNNPDDANKNDLLTDAEKYAIGEIGNISMGTAATTLFSLVNRKVDISTLLCEGKFSCICRCFLNCCTLCCREVHCGLVAKTAGDSFVSCFRSIIKICCHLSV